MGFRTLLLSLMLVFASAPAAAETSREILVSAAFISSDKASALKRIDEALKTAEAALARNPADQDNQLGRAIALSYRGKITRSRADLMAARQGMEAVVAANPRNAEAQMALAGWHIGAVIELGGFMAQTALGARRAAGRQAQDRALALGGGRAFFPALASLQTILLDPADVAGARRLAEGAIACSTPTAMDRVMQRQAAAILPLLKAGNGKAAAQVAKLMLPFGRVH